MASSVPQLSVLTSLFKSEGYLDSFLEQVECQSLFPELELVLVLNEASQAENETARSYAQRHPDKVRLLYVDPVETLGASWNRAWRAARAPILAIWNVDDRRPPDSLERQLDALHVNPAWMLCYGDYLAVPEYGVEDGRRRHTPIYQPAAFRRGFPQGGAFWLFRAELAEYAGYFDEQFKVAADFDLSLRMAFLGLEMGRADGLVGYFTDADRGLSTRQGANLSAVERTALQQRYAIYDKVRSEFQHAAREYDLDNIYLDGQPMPLSNYLPALHQFRRSRRWLKPLGLVRNALRGALRALGILDWLYRLQGRHRKRGI